jgi:5,10-methenyltetrahydromethanopterin hydrogenase
VSETKWTPGPLEVSVGDWTSGDGLSITKDGAFVAEVYGSDLFPCFDADDPAVVEQFNQRQFADAHLYAAAPDLYEALEQIVLLADGCEVTAEEIYASYDAARAALARARGEA